MEDITDEYDITKKMIKKAKNLTANGERKTDTTKNQKVVALTTELIKMKNCLKNADHGLNTGIKGNRNGTKKKLFKGSSRIQWPSWDISQNDFYIARKMCFFVLLVNSEQLTDGHGGQKANFMVLYVLLITRNQETEYQLII